MNAPDGQWLVDEDAAISAAEHPQEKIVVVAGIVWAPTLAALITPGFQEIPGKLELTITLARVMWPFLLLVALAAVAIRDHGPQRICQRLDVARRDEDAGLRRHDRRGPSRAEKKITTKVTKTSLGAPSCPSW